MNNDTPLIQRNNIFWIQIAFSIIWCIILCFTWEIIEKNLSLFPIYFLLFVIPATVNTSFCYKLNKQSCLSVFINGIALLPLFLYVIFAMGIHPHTNIDNYSSGFPILYLSGYLVYIYHVLVSEKCEITKDVRLLKVMKVLKIMRNYIPICLLLIGLILFITLFIINGFSLGLF